jgi:hypothetical protein
MAMGRSVCFATVTAHFCVLYKTPIYQGEISNVRRQFRKRVKRRNSKPAKFTYVARQDC